MRNTNEEDRYSNESNTKSQDKDTMVNKESNTKSRDKDTTINRRTDKSTMEISKIEIDRNISLTHNNTVVVHTSISEC